MLNHWHPFGQKHWKIFIYTPKIILYLSYDNLKLFDPCLLFYQSFESLLTKNYIWQTKNPIYCLLNWFHFLLLHCVLLIFWLPQKSQDIVANKMSTARKYAFDGIELTPLQKLSDVLDYCWNILISRQLIRTHS